MTSTNEAIIDKLLQLDEYKKILKDIKLENEKFIKGVSLKINTLENSIKDINEKLAALDNRIASLEKLSEKVCELEKSLDDLRDTIKKFDESLKDVKKMAEDVKREKDTIEIKYAALLERLKSLI